MQKTSKKSTVTRYRFSVPDDDISVVQWLENQHSISMSMRLLIRDAIRSTGLQDVTCIPVEQYAKRGRPSNAELAARERELNNTVKDEAPAEVRRAPAEPAERCESYGPVPKIEPKTPEKTYMSDPEPERVPDDNDYEDVGVVMPIGQTEESKKPSSAANALLDMMRV